MKSSRGWSLLEVLIVVSVAAVAGSLLLNILVSSNDLFLGQSTQISHGLSLNDASSEITDLIRACAGIASQYPASGAAQYATDSDTLVIKLPSLDGSGNVIDSVYDYAVIEKDSSTANVLRERILPNVSSSRKSANKVLTTALKSVKFNYLDSLSHSISPTQAERVNFIILLSSDSGASVNESSASGTVNIKNI